MKTLKCKNCKQPHTPFNSLDNWCKDVNCQTKKAMFLLEKKKKSDKKEWGKEKKKRKEALKTNSDYVRELQVIFNKYIRLRDKDKGCISCGKPLVEKYDAGHFYSTGSYPELRFEEYNVHGQCVHCNQHKRGNLLEYREMLNKKMPTILGHLEDLKGLPRKYTITELKELKEYYKQKIKELNI